MRKDRRLFVLEIQDELIKGGLIENSGGNIFLRNIASFSRDKKAIETEIKRLQMHKWHKKNTIIIVSPKKAMIRYLELPSSNRRELKDMINFQLPRYLPYNFSDIIFDFRIVEKKKEDYFKVMVVCIQKQLFKEVLEIIPNLEDSLYGVFLCGEMGIELLNASQKSRKDTEALVDISSEEVSLSIFDSSGVIFMRYLNAAFFIREKEWSKGLEELERSFIAFGREFGERKIDSIVITGAGSYTSNFYNFLKEQGNRPVELFNPFDHVRCEKLAMAKLNNFSFHAIIGAGVSPEKGHINLIPQEFLSKKERLLKRATRLHIFLFATIIIFQLSFILYKRIDKKRAYLNYLKGEIKKTESRARAIEDKEKKTSLIKAQLDMEGSSLDVLREVYRIISQSISLNILIFEKDNILRIRGTARTMAEVINLIPKLEKSPYFDKVISEGIRMRKIKGEVVADFQIRASLNNGKE